MKKLLLATLLAGMYSTANAGIQVPAGDWTLDIGGVVNAYYTNTRGTGSAVVGGLGGPNANAQRNASRFVGQKRYRRTRCSANCRHHISSLSSPPVHKP